MSPQLRHPVGVYDIAHTPYPFVGIGIDGIALGFHPFEVGKERTAVADAAIEFHLVGAGQFA